MIVLTSSGLYEVVTFIKELEAKRKEILDAGKDTADDTSIPTIDDILLDIEFFEEHGEYCNNWGCTDHYNGDWPLYLELGVHYYNE